ncbi:MAG: lycopene beta-cyclase CrtY [Croceibacterium sp.]
MNRNDCDVAIVGGGLAGGLIALALAERRPDVSVRLIEAGPTLGGKHRWSWFASDLSPEGEALMAKFAPTVWEEGYEVHFPRYRRHLQTPYASLSSVQFASSLERLLPHGAILPNSPVASLDAAGVTLASGGRITASAVIDCRGFAPTPHLRGGWQVFLGRHLRTVEPHGVTRPLIMDATVGQTGGYRFVYVLPLGEHDLFVEDTYYQNRPTLDDEALSRRLDRYTSRKNWRGETIDIETGVLPVVTGGNIAAWQAERRIAGVARAGAHAGFQHPLTSYTLPFAVSIALAVAGAADLSGPGLAALLDGRARAHWAQTRFYRRLGSMMLGASPADKRWKVFARFYHLPTDLIERFYAGQSTRADRLRILCGKPPVSPLRALRALVTSRATLQAAQ